MQVEVSPTEYCCIMFALVIGHKQQLLFHWLSGNCAVILNEATRTLKCKTYLLDFLFRLLAVCIFILQMYFMCDIVIICVTGSQWNLVDYFGGKGKI